MAHSVSRFSIRSLLPRLVLTLTLLAGAGTLVAAGGTCTSAEIGEPFLLPDGSRHPGGRVTLCLGRDFTPVTSLHRTFVDNEPVGLFFARREAGDAGAAVGYYLIFERRPGATLRLAGYSLPANGTTETFLLDQPARVEVEDSIELVRSGDRAPRIVSTSVR